MQTFVCSQFENVNRSKLQFLENFMGNGEKYRLLQNIIQRKVEGKKGSGRRIILWLANLLELP